LSDAIDAQLLRLLSVPAAWSESPLNSSTPEEWQKILEQATALGVSPLLFDALRQGQAAHTAPADVMQTLGRDYAAVAIYNLRLYQGLHAILQALREHQIDVIVLKGAYLAQVVYGNVALRPMGDVDILVRPEALDRVAELLDGLDYVPALKSTVGNEPQSHDLFIHPAGIPDLEVHWTLVNPVAPYRIDLDGLWARASASTVAGVPVQVLSPVDTILHLCIHTSYQHVFHHYSLRGLCDLQRCLEWYGDQVDWRELCSRSAAWRANRSVYLALRLAGDLLGAAVPAHALEKLRPNAFDDRLLDWAAHRVLGKVDDTQGPWSGNLGRWRLSTRLGERFALAKSICFPPRRWLAQRYGLSEAPGHLPLFYLRRWGELAASAMRHMAHSSFRQPASDRSTQPVDWQEREMGRTALVQWLHGEG
jgi:hypothetical protein